MRLCFLLLVCLASPALGQEQIKQSPARQTDAIESMRDEIKSLKNELQLIRDLLQMLVDNQPASPASPTAPATRKVWKKVRPSIQIEGMIDDGYELVEEPIRKKPK